MSAEKDYSLLRPFDLEAAKRGETICFQGVESSTGVTYIAGPDKRGNIICDVGGYFNEYFHTALRMAPLCWVEGKPVYKGDVLYLIGAVDDLNKQPLKVEANSGGWWCRHQNGAVPKYSEDRLTWTPPKVKREGWVNIYQRPLSGLVASVSHAYASKDAADAVAVFGRIDCIRIEWEEPAGTEGGAS